MSVAGSGSGSVFLSYAREDAEAARQIAAALEAAGISVWFDQSALRGGDAWDAQIRRQVANCALFVPVISAASASRGEGYFRLEWAMAEERSRRMARSRPFIVPVSLDGTREADVPDAFWQAQWTDLPSGTVPAGFVERIRTLLKEVAAPPKPSRPAVVPGSAATTAASPAGATLAAPAAAMSWRPGRTVLAVLALAALVLAGWAGWNRALEEPEVAIAEAPSAPPRSVAVLPFENLSADPEQQYFSDGLAEELLNELAQVKDLRVPGRRSSFFFKGKDTPAAEIGRQLGVAHLLEGSVRRAGEQLRVSAALVRASDGVQLWSETYDRKLEDVFAVQDEIAAAVVAALELQLSPIATQFRTTNPQAYDLYLRARSLSYEGSPEDDRRGLEALRRALALDPGFAPAHALKSRLLFFMANDSGDAEGFRQALAAAERAIELAPQLPDGYIARALYHQYRGQDWSRAQADLEVALALAPDAPASQFLLGSLSWTLGRGPEALAAFERATEADPLRIDAFAMCGSVLTALGRYEEARTAFARTLEISPRSVITLSELATLELVSGNAPAALATASRNEDEFWRLYATALAKHSLGDHEGSSAALAELIAKHADAGAYQIAVVHGWRGETDLAFDWLERARIQRDGGLGNLLLDPLLRSLHSDPRWPEFVQKMGLPLSPDPPASR